MSGHGYAVLTVDEAVILRGTSPGYGWRQARSRDEVRTGFLDQGSQAVRRARTRQDPRKCRGEDEFWDVRGISQEVARGIRTARHTVGQCGLPQVQGGRRVCQVSLRGDQAGLPSTVHPATQPNRDPVEGAQRHACRQILWVYRRSYPCNNEFD